MKLDAGFANAPWLPPAISFYNYPFYFFSLYLALLCRPRLLASISQGELTLAAMAVFHGVGEVREPDVHRLVAVEVGVVALDAILWDESFGLGCAAVPAVVDRDLDLRGGRDGKLI